MQDSVPDVSMFFSVWYFVRDLLKLYQKMKRIYPFRAFFKYFCLFPTAPNDLERVALWLSQLGYVVSLKIE